MQQSELASVQLEWKMSEEEEEGREGESVEDEYEEEVGEEEDLKQQQNVLKGEEDQIYLMKLMQHQLIMSSTLDWRILYKEK